MEELAGLGWPDTLNIEYWTLNIRGLTSNTLDRKDGSADIIDFFYIYGPTCFVLTASPWNCYSFGSNGTDLSAYQRHVPRHLLLGTFGGSGVSGSLAYPELSEACRDARLYT